MLLSRGDVFGFIESEWAISWSELEKPPFKSPRGIRFETLPPPEGHQRIKPRTVLIPNQEILDFIVVVLQRHVQLRAHGPTCSCAHFVLDVRLLTLLCLLEAFACPGKLAIGLVKFGKYGVIQKKLFKGHFRIMWTAWSKKNFCNGILGQRTISVQIFKIFGCHQNHG